MKLLYIFIFLMSSLVYGQDYPPINEELDSIETMLKTIEDDVGVIDVGNVKTKNTNVKSESTIE